MFKKGTMNPNTMDGEAELRRYHSHYHRAPPDAQNSENSNKPKFFHNQTENQRKSQKKRRKTTYMTKEGSVKQKSSFQDDGPHQYPVRLKNDEHSRLEIFFKARNFPTDSEYFLKVQHEDQNMTLNLGRRRHANFEKPLLTEFIFELSQVVKVRVYDDLDRFMGSCSFQIGELVGSSRNCLDLEIKLNKKEKKKNLNFFGSVKSESEEGYEKVTLKVMYESLLPSLQEMVQARDQKKFLEFLKGNLNISLVLCVDFTASNLHHPGHNSLHSLYEKDLNEYQSAIASVGSVLINYDNDKIIPVFGFGAIPKRVNFDYLRTPLAKTDSPKKGQRNYKNVGFGAMIQLSRSKIKQRPEKERVKKKHSSLNHFRSIRDVMDENVQASERMVEKRKVSHFFPISGSWEECAVRGVDGVFGLYTECLKQNYFKMSGPTLFAPMLKEINKYTLNNFNEDPYNYTVLMILTDGVIHDMEDTIEQIILGSELPLSIIIVGLGTEDFEYMKILDSDKHALKDKNCNLTSRDIIQFVDYSDFDGEQKDFRGLGEEVLKEIPQQVTGFYALKGIKPKPPLAPQQSIYRIEEV